MLNGVSVQKDGNSVLQVNVLSTSLLSLLLLPLLVQTGRTFPESRPHLVLLSSNIHGGAKLKERNAENTLETLNDKKTWEESKAGVSERYAVSKLFDLYVSIELAGLAPLIDGEPAVIVDSVAPGFCKSELLSREPGVPWLLKVLEYLTARTVQEGSKTIVDAAMRRKDAHGKYLSHQEIAWYVLFLFHDSRFL